jgi:acyl dehydratase
MQPPAVEGPYFDELVVGQKFAAAPGITLSPGLAAIHQSITGDRLALTLEAARWLRQAWSGISRSASPPSSPST